MELIAANDDVVGSLAFLFVQKKNNRTSNIDHKKLNEMFINGGSGEKKNTVPGTHRP